MFSIHIWLSCFKYCCVSCSQSSFILFFVGAFRRAPTSEIWPITFTDRRPTDAHTFVWAAKWGCCPAVCDSPFVQQLQFESSRRHHPPEAAVVTVDWQGEALVIFWWKETTDEKMQRSETFFLLLHFSNWTFLGHLFKNNPFVNKVHEVTHHPY